LTVSASRAKIASFFGTPQRRSVRAAIGGTVAFYLGWIVIHDAELAVFAILSVIGLLVLADFGGNLARQARAYALATLLAAALVALGTAVSEDTFAAAGLLFVVTLCVSLSTAVGRNVAMGANGVLLFFLVACAVPAPLGALDARVSGVLLGGGISLLAALTIWPQRPLDRLRPALANATEALSRRIGRFSQRREDAADSFAEPVREALASEGPERLAVGERPTLASERDHAQLRMGYGLSRVQLLSDRLSQRPLPPPGVADAERILARELRQVLDATVAALRGEGRVPEVDVALDAGRAHRERTDTALVGELSMKAADDTLAVGADRSVLAGDLCTSVGGVVTDARVVVGADRFPARGSSGDGLERRVQAVRDRLVTIVSSTLNLRSVLLQNSLRLAVALSLARLLGGLLQVEHAFWVLFATLSVLRTSAIKTTATAFQAVLGTLLGLAVGVPLILATVTRDDIQLYLLPIVIVGGLLAGSINVVWGQAGFTALVVVLFDLVEPGSWQIGIVRIQDVVLGAAAGVVLGLAAWPRGAGGQLAQSVADAIEACGELVAATVRRRLRPVGLEQVSRLRSRARATALRADGVLAVFLNERPKAEEIALWEQMSVFVHTRWYGAEMLARQPVESPPREAAKVVDTLAERLHDLHAAHTALAAAIARREPPPPVRCPIDVDRLDAESRELAATRLDDPWAERWVVQILRIRASIAEIMVSLSRLRDLVAEQMGSSPEPERAGAAAAPTS
jgi:uncharacterized membrane protein YccC